MNGLFRAGDGNGTDLFLGLFDRQRACLLEGAIFVYIAGVVKVFYETLQFLLPLGPL